MPSGCSPLAPGRQGDITRFAVQCLPGGETGTAFAVAASGTPGNFQLISAASANLSPGRYDLTATLLPPAASDRIRFDGLPVILRADHRKWQEIVASIPDRLPGPAHLIMAVEICGSAAEVKARINQASKLISHIASSRQGQVRFSLLSYGSHSHDRRIDEEPVTILSWENRDQDTLARSLHRLRECGPAISSYPRAASIECMLAEVSRQLSGHRTFAARPVLVTIGSRPAFPSRVDPVTEILPCPLRNDWPAILSQLRNDHPEVTFGAIRDGKPVDPQQDTADDIWQLLGADARAPVTSESDVRRFTADLGLTSPGLQYIPLPLAD